MTFCVVLSFLTWPALCSRTGRCCSRGRAIAGAGASIKYNVALNGGALAAVAFVAPGSGGLR